MILGIFFARFLSEQGNDQGTRVVHQSPPGCIVPSPGISKAPLVSWDVLSEYVIPRQAFCNRYVSVLDPTSKYRVLSHPVCIKNEALYFRNEFIFNFGLVVDGEIWLDELVYESVVRRLAAFFTEMEIQERFLSEERDGGGTRSRGGGQGEGEERRSIAALLEIIKEDLNNYNECMIPVDDANTINMKLFPPHLHPPPIKPWLVPLTTLPLLSLSDPTWDLTLLSTISAIDSISPISQLASKNSLSPHLVAIALQHLLYYDALLLLDTFLFSNTYALTPDFWDMVTDRGNEGLLGEAAEYVLVNGTGDGEGERLDGGEWWLVRLYASLCLGRTVKEWLAVHASQGFAVLNYVDVRRFIQFGVIKGLVYRVHRYPVSAAEMKGEKVVYRDVVEEKGQPKVKDGTAEEQGKVQLQYEASTTQSESPSVQSSSFQSISSATPTLTAHKHDSPTASRQSLSMSILDSLNLSPNLSFQIPKTSQPSFSPPPKNSTPSPEIDRNEEDERSGLKLGPEILAGSVDGLHCFDQITADFNTGDEKILGLLKRFPKGDVDVIYR